MNRRTVVTVLFVVVVLAVVLWVRMTTPTWIIPTELPSNSPILTNAWVIDGDTIDATRRSGEKVRIRILGIDAPEIAHSPTPADCGGDAAKTALIRLVDGKTVTITTDPGVGEKDQYGRVLAYVSIGGIADVGLRLVQDGMVAAWHPASEPEPTRYASYVVAQDAARTAGNGSWPTCGTLGR